MIAILLNNGRVKGVYPEYTENVEIMDDFILVSELPATFIDLPENMIVKYENGAFTRETVPPPAKSLEEQIEDLKEQLAVTNATVDFLLGI
jgi:hypothetical protein